MKDRVRKLLLSEGMTSGAFADEIGVQRSSLSHILNGRNNPSLDFVVKTKNRFPRLNLAWLIMGKGDMYLSDNQESNVDSVRVSSSPTIFNAFPEDVPGKIAESPPERLDNEIRSPDLSNSEISQILIFYDDLSFTAYKPRKNT